MPGVSRKTTCASGSVRMPRMRLRVVCGLGVTMATLAPTSALSSVDLPTFGRPTMAAYPARWAIAALRRAAERHPWPHRTARVGLRTAGVEDVQAERHAQRAVPVGRAVGIALRVAVAAGLARRGQAIAPYEEELLLDQPLAGARVPAAAARHHADEVRLAGPGPVERPRQRVDQRRTPAARQVEARPGDEGAVAARDHVAEDRRAHAGLPR